MSCQQFATSALVLVQPTCLLQHVLNFFCCLLQGLSGCNLLQRLDASGNCLSTFPASLHLPMLQQLDLSSNRFASWPDLPPMPHLRQLSVADNQIVQLQRLAGCLQLQALDVSFNQLAGLQRCLACVAGAPSLQQLQLHDNPCCTVAGMGWQQQQQQLGQPGQVGDAAGSGNTWYRQQVVAALPWLQQLDRDELYVQRNSQLLQQLSWQQEQGHCTGSLQQAMAVGHAIASRGMFGVKLMRQIRSGSIQLGLPLQQAVAAAAATARESGAAGSASRHLQDVGYACPAGLAAATAAAWLPHLTHAASAAGCAAVGLWPSQLDQATQQQQLQQQLPSKHITCAAAGTPADSGGGGGSSSSWAEQVQQQWSYSTRAMLVFWQAQEQQQQQQRVASKHQHLSGAGYHADMSQHATVAVLPPATAAAAAAAAEAEAAYCGVAEMCMDHRHLEELTNQPFSQHQQQLLQHTQYAAQQAALVSNTAVLLQCSWRARCVRLHYKQQLQQYQQQQVLAAAAEPLQSMWRGRQARQLTVLMREQRQQELMQGAAARHAAAARIQAAVRGFGVRRRLRAALAAACSSTGGAAAAGAAARGVWLGLEASSWDDDDFGGVADDFVSMPPALLQELMHPQLQGSGSGSGWVLDASNSGSSSGSQGGQAAGNTTSFQVLAAATSSSYGALAPALAAQPSAPHRATSSSDAQHHDHRDEGSTADVGDVEPAPDSPETGHAAAAGGGGAAAAAAARHEAKLQQLMQEWGFTDRATAEVYYR
jgi:hypothetical protein